MTTLLLPTSDVVAVALVQTFTRLPDTSKVATSLPRDTTGWASTGFVQVSAAVGGSPLADLPRRSPVMSIDCWALSAGNRPPWRQANVLAEIVRTAMDAPRGAVMVDLTLPAGYPACRVLAARPITEPVKRPTPAPGGPGDAGSWARYGFDMIMHWVQIG